MWLAGGSTYSSTGRPKDEATLTRIIRIGVGTWDGRIIEEEEFLPFYGVLKGAVSQEQVRRFIQKMVSDGQFIVCRQCFVELTSEFVSEYYCINNNLYSPNVHGSYLMPFLLPTSCLRRVNRD